MKKKLSPSAMRKSTRYSDRVASHYTLQAYEAIAVLGGNRRAEDAPIFILAWSGQGYENQSKVHFQSRVNIKMKKRADLFRLWRGLRLRRRLPLRPARPAEPVRRSSISITPTTDTHARARSMHDGRCASTGRDRASELSLESARSTSPRPVPAGAQAAQAAADAKSPPSPGSFGRGRRGSRYLLAASAAEPSLWA